MATPVQAQKKAGMYKNPQETLRSVGGSQDVLRSQEGFGKQPQEAPKRGPVNREIIAFDKTSYQESHLKDREIQRIQETIYAIQREVKEIRNLSAGIGEEVTRIERAALQALPERVGVYHVRYFELILQYLRNIKAKVGESRTWMTAMQSKKAKRGSAFAARSKKHGTQYSMSQEQQLARSVG